MEFIERLKADLITVGGALRALRYTTHIAKNPTRVFPQLVEELSAKYGDAPALLSDRERYSYRELGARSNRYARWAMAQGVAKGDTICLLMPNRPEFLALWIGVTRVGGVVALLNTNLMGTALAHCINVVVPKHIVVDADMLGALQSAQPHLTSNAKIWLYGDAGASHHASIARSKRCPATRSPTASGALSPSRTAPCSSTPRAPRACPRRRTSITTGSCSQPTPSPRS
jgi:fatty-acyl-CoA synthase